MNILNTPFGDLTLARWSEREDEHLRAWDAADEYLLQHLSDNNLLAANPPPRVLIVNDSFGALTCALNRYAPVSWSDSVISHRATTNNCGRNGMIAEHTLLSSMEPLEGLFDLVLIKVPKANAFLEDHLHKLKPHLHARSVVVAASMVKHLPRTAYQCFEAIIGSTVPSRALKKARLLQVTPDDSIVAGENPNPTSYTDPQIDMELINHAGVFSREHLDHGSRFLLQHYGEMPDAQRVVDLGCGNGVLGIVYQQQHAAAQLQFIDESYMAVASARENYQKAFPQSTASFEAADGLSDSEPESLDLILCNPPFHQQYIVGSQIAVGMFRQSKRCLRQHGELWIVANRHLTYAGDLKRLFGNCRAVAANKKFVVLRAIKR